MLGSDSVIATGLWSVAHSFDSERIFGGGRLELGDERDVRQHGDLDHSTRSGVPSAGGDDASDGTCTVTDTTRQSVLGRVISPARRSCRAERPRRAPE